MTTGLEIAIITGLLGMLGWGLADFFTKKTVDRIGDLRTQFWSQLFGIIPVMIYLFFNFELPDFTLRTISYLVGVSISGAIAILLFFRALTKGKLSVISPVYNSWAAFVVLVSFFIFHASE